MKRNLDDVKASVVGADDAEQGEEKQQRSAAAILVDIAQAKFDLGLSETGDAFAVPKTGARIASMLRGGKTSLRSSLARDFFHKTGRVAPQQALSDALTTLDGFAQDMDPTRLYLRVAEHQESLYLDLGGNSGQAVRIQPGEWSIDPRPPVLFMRTPLTGALPVPERGGSIDELWRWANVTPDDRPLVIAFLVATLYPDIAHVILGIFGQQGAGKTTFMRALVQLLDASPVPYRKPPRDSDSWITAASGSWMVGLDNVSTVGEALSDTLCRASTGEGDVRRKLYTDGELHVYAFRRVVLMTGIDLGSLPGDLADRLLPITLDVISEDRRLEEATMWPAWRVAHPRVLGALLDVAADVMRVMPELKLDRMPRMADFARIVDAVDHVLDARGLKRYLGAQGRLAADTLSGDTFITTVMETIRRPFVGTSAELLEQVTPTDDKWRPPKGWPSNARVVTQRLRRQAPVMRKAGWSISDDGASNHDKVLRWSIEPPQPEGTGDVPPQYPQPPQRDHEPRQGHAPRREGSAGIAPGSRGDRLAIPATPAPIPAPTEHQRERQGQRSDARAGTAGIAGVEVASPLLERATALVADLRCLELADLRERYRQAADALAGRVDIPPYITIAAKTQPVQATAAIMLLGSDSASGNGVKPWPVYLTATRSAFASEAAA